MPPDFVSCLVMLRPSSEGEAVQLEVAAHRCRTYAGPGAAGPDQVFQESGEYAEGLGARWEQWWWRE